jgi:IS30 family transposase
MSSYGISQIKINDKNLIIFQQEYLDKIARALNGRPRKVLGFRTPEEVFSQEVIQLHNAVALQS